MIEYNGNMIMTKAEFMAHNAEVQELNKRIESLQDAIFQLITGREDNTATADIMLSKSDFLALYDRAISAMFADDDTNDIYGHDVTVHWHGLACNCADGAQACNYIIEGVREVLEEDGD